jgi:hypothetical protein
MIGKPEWFTYRIFGWGIAPKTKEGWLYILLAIGIAAGIAVIPMQENYRIALIVGFISILLMDVVHVMIQLSKTHDERENMHQLIIERNCSYAALGAIIAVAFHQSRSTGIFDMSLMVVLGVMLFTKILSTIYVKVRV